MKHSMIATKAFTYSGRALKVGDFFEASERDAMILQGTRKARQHESPQSDFSPPEEHELDEGTQSPDGARRSKRRYRRRDMQAE